MHLHLQTTHGPIWHNDLEERLFVRGYGIDQEGQVFRGVDLLDAFAGIQSEAGWLRRLKGLDGSFSVIWKQGETTYVAVDNQRSLPVLYSGERGEWHLASELAFLPGKRDPDPIQWQLFPHACHTLGIHTLWAGVCQFQAGEWGKIKGNSTRHLSYAAPFQEAQPAQSDLLQPQKFREQAMNMMDRCLKSIGNQPIVVPLSGGYDSRFLVALLKEFGKTEVTCFTYGRSSSFEVETSRKVARKLGFPWHFVGYEDDLLRLYLTEKGRAYQRYANNGTSLAHEQDYFAIHELLKERKISPDSVLLPGFGADVLAGSWYPQKAPSSWNHLSFVKFLLSNRKFFAGSRRVQLPEETQTLMEEGLPAGEEVHDLASAYQQLQQWGFQNRMSQFLVNAVRVYDFHSLEWRLPFFDKSWINYWEQVPLEQKIGKQWYLQQLNQGWFEPMGIRFDPSAPQPQPMKDRLKDLLPSAWIDWLKSVLVDREAVDLNNQDALSRLICEDQQWDQKLLRSYDLNYLMAKAFLARNAYL
ncbi:MAG: asparagine synthase C-terminal domain-containing protein [Bacteroidota bacterium]